MAGITHDFRGVAVVSPGNGEGKEHARVLDRECNAYLNDVYYIDYLNARASLRTDIQPLQITNLTATGTVSSPLEGTYNLGASATPIALTAPATANNGQIIRFINQTAAQKVITGLFIDASGNPQTTLTLANSIGNFAELVAVSSGRWQNVVNKGATYS